MIIDRETFVEIAVHLKFSSDAVLSVARGLAVIQNTSSAPPSDERAWSDVLDGLMNINTEISFLERTFRALLNANAEEEGKSVPQPS